MPVASLLPSPSPHVNLGLTYVEPYLRLTSTPITISNFVPLNTSLLLSLDDGFGDLRIFTQALNGTTVINTDRTITYTPDTWFIGSDSLEHWIEDIHGDKDIA